MKMEREMAREIERDGYASFDGRAWIASSEYMQAEQERWDEEDEAKGYDFTRYPYYAKGIADDYLEGFESLGDALASLE